MFVLPLGSIMVELFMLDSREGILFLLGKWFVFWSVGVRLFLAGMHRVIQPRFTVKTIFNIDRKEPSAIVHQKVWASSSVNASAY